MFPRSFEYWKIHCLNPVHRAFWSQSVFFVWDFICYFVVVLIKENIKKVKIPKDFFTSKCRFLVPSEQCEALQKAWLPPGSLRQELRGMWLPLGVRGCSEAISGGIWPRLLLTLISTARQLQLYSHELREGKVSQWVSELNMGVRASRWQGSCDNWSWKCPIFMKPEFNSMKWPTKVYVMFPAPTLAAEA